VYRTGVRIDTETQLDILNVARKHDLMILCDEIFHPLYHGDDASPPSFVEHDYSKIVVTSSMSKVWAMSGVRIGWMICRDSVMVDTILNAREYTLQGTAVIDEVIATEALSDRCRPALLKRHLDYARQNLLALDAFVKENSDMVSWTRPTAGATAFVQFCQPGGQPMDDTALGRQMLRNEALLVTPGSVSFSDGGRDDFRGYLRLHLTTTPANLHEGLARLNTFLEKVRRREINVQ
jgi:aspartate/methionine/tyrosine aminotransferase